MSSIFGMNSIEIGGDGNTMHLREQFNYMCKLFLRTQRGCVQGNPHTDNLILSSWPLSYRHRIDTCLLLERLASCFGVVVLCNSHIAFCYLYRTV